MNKLSKTQTVFPQTEAIPAPLEIHPSVSPLAAELLMKTVEAISLAPSRYHQGNNVVAGPGCGTPCCILGHMEIAKNGRPAKGGIVSVTSRDGSQYGLTDAQCERLYRSTLWPEPFTMKHECNYCEPSVGIARIEFFLRTGQ